LSESYKPSIYGKEESPMGIDDIEYQTLHLIIKIIPAGGTFNIN